MTESGGTVVPSGPEVVTTGDKSLESTNLEEDVVLKCSICFDTGFYSGNEIITCGKCKVSLHIKCYDAKVSNPDDPWLCDVCAAGEDVNKPLCELCSFTGGALKKSDKDQWVHTLCSNWIPEIYVRDTGEGGLRVTLDNLDKKRYRLKCAMCSTKGASIQCSFGRCATAAHPWCVFHNNKGFTKRVVKSEDGEPIWEMFCKQHAACVSEPVKPRPKPKMEYYAADSDMYMPRPKPKGKVKLTMSHALRFAKGKGSSEGSGAAGGKTTSTRASSGLSSTGSSGTTFPIYTMDEWPGQTEGEPLDLDHFWRVIAMGYPEDHSPEWLQYVLGPVTRAVDGARNHSLMDTLAKLGGQEEMMTDETKLDGLFAAIGNDRDRAQILDLEKWDMSHQIYKQALSSLAGSGTKSSSSSSSSSSGSNSSSRSDINGMEDREASQADSQTSLTATAAARAPSGLLPDNDFYIKSGPRSGAKTKIGPSSIEVLFDGDARARATFRVTLGGGDKQKGASEVSLTGGSDAEAKEWVAEHVIGSALIPNGAEGEDTASLCLTSIGEVADDENIYISDRTIVSKNEDDFLSRMIRSDQKAYKELIRAIGARLSKIQDSPEWAQEARSGLDERATWKALGDKYLKQRVWKKVATCMTKGVRDQRADFNKPVEEEAVPASWAIQVKGRPAAPAAEPEEPAEDAVCMVCFNGVSDDDNCILFCDGCNATVHQACYGVAEVPEGDFFCERCRTVTELVESPEVEFSYHDCARGVMCCLCPLQHGGLKSTTDGRWVHLCCAIWAKDSVITNLPEMGPVDVSKVPVQGVLDDTSRSNRAAFRSSTQDATDLAVSSSSASSSSDVGTLTMTGGSANYPHESPCMHCKVLGGHLLKCKHRGCDKVFHPLCAWFAGAHVECAVTDDTFQALDRGGNYPAGMTFKFSCDDHAPTDREKKPEHTSGSVSQKAIRTKYRIKEDDLEGLPGKGKRYRRASVPTPRPPPPKIKDLNKDTYHRACGLCLGPLTGADAGKKPAAPPRQATTSAADAASNDSMVVVKEEGGDEEAKQTAEHVSGDAVDVETGTTSAANAVISTATGTNTIDAKAKAAAITPVLDSSSVVCSTCKMAAHVKCHVKNGGSAADAGSSTYQCDTCRRDLEDPRCIFCPRRGGLFKPTQDGRWAHAYCSNSCPGQTCVAGGVVQMSILPKQAAKQKCFICNRKHGIAVKCMALGCNNFFHTLCGEKSGKGYHRERAGTMTTYCAEHMPEGIEKVHAGYFIDGYEACRLRYTLERGRLIADTLLRREKFKKALSKAEDDAFTQRFWKLLDKAKGRKYAGTRDEGGPDEDLKGTGGSDVDNEEDELAETESESDSSEEEFFDDDSVLGKRAYTPKRREDLTFVYGSRIEDEQLEDMNFDSEDEEGEHRISGFYATKKGELRIPRKITVGVAGLKVVPKDVHSEKSKRSYMAAMAGLMEDQRTEFRESVGIFEDVDDWNEFARKIGGQFKKWGNQKSSAFARDMDKNHGITVTFHEVDEEDADDEMPPKPVPKPKKVKKGYALVPIDEQETDDDEEMMSVDEEEPTPVKKKGGRPPKRKFTEEEQKEQLLQQLLERASAAKETTLAAMEASAAAASTASGPFRTQKELAGVLGVDPLTAAIADSVKDHKTGFGGVLSFAQMQPLNDAAAEDGNVVQRHKDLLALERRIQDILVGIDDYEVEDDVPEEEEAKVKAKKAKTSGGKRRPRARKTSEIPMRSPIEDYRAVPYELIPDYDLTVRRAIGFDDILEKLRTHRYDCLNAVSKDFYDMLNNGRIVTKPSSTTWKDSRDLANLFEQLKQSSALAGPETVQRVHKLDYFVTSKKKGGVEYVDKTCAHCKKPYHLSGWPWPEGEEEPEAKGKWWCPDCVTSSGESFVGREVFVWWHDDSRFYEGRVDAFDSSSGRHRVLYEDGEWTFYNLGFEVAYFGKASS